VSCAEKGTKKYAAPDRRPRKYFLACSRRRRFTKPRERGCFVRPEARAKIVREWCCSRNAVVLRLNDDLAEASANVLHFLENLDVFEVSGEPGAGVRADIGSVFSELKETAALC